MTRNSFMLTALVLNLAFSTSVWAQQSRPVKFLFGGGPFSYSGGGCDSGCDCGAPPKCDCGAPPKCGCDAPPKCGCDAPPSCGCDSGCGGKGGCTAICIRQCKIPNPFPGLIHDLHCGYDSMIRGACHMSPRSFSIPVLDLMSCGGGGGCDSGCDCGAPPTCGCDAKPGCGCGANFCDCHNGGGGGKGYAPPQPMIDSKSPFQDDIPTPPTPPTAYRGKAPVRLPHSYLHRSAGFRY